MTKYTTLSEELNQLTTERQELGGVSAFKSPNANINPARVHKMLPN